jgi:hypothetical protein
MKLPEQHTSGAPDHILRFLGAVARKINGLASGAVSARDGALTAAPTTGTWAQGDEVRNAAPVELGAAGSKYVLTGWICTAGGSPGTWREMRVLTGN